MVCWKFYNKVETAIGNVFARYGELVGTYPWVVLIMAVLVSGLLGIGLINLKFESDVEKVYTPTDSQASQDRSRIKDLFVDDSGENFYSQNLAEANLFGTMIFQSKNDSNLLTVPYIQEIQSIYNQIRTNVLGNGMNYSQLCAVRGNTCVVDGDIIFTASFSQLLQSGSITYPLLGNVSLESIFGDVIFQRGVLQSAKFIKLVFNLRQDTTEHIDNSKLWEKDFVSHSQNIQSMLVDVAYAHSTSLDEELTSNISGDILFVSLTFTLMIVYATFVTMTCNCLLDRQNLGRAGVTTTGLGILASFGLVSACGVEFVDIVGVMPFLVLGIGIDDMFILLAGLAEAPIKESAEKRVAETMRTSGVAITITSLTDIIAFSVGASSVFPGVRNFCIYTGIAVLFCYFNFVTFFIACIAINERRVSAEKHCCICCHRIEKKDDMVATSRLHRFCCVGTALTSVSDMQSLLERLPGQTLVKFITLTPVKIVTIISFVAYLGVSIWGATNFKQGLDTTNLVSDDSYYFTYNQQNQKHFLQRIPVSFVIDETLDYTLVSTVNSIDSLITQVQNDKTVGNNNLVISWFNSFRSSPIYVNTSESQFVTNLKLFLNSNEEFKNDVRFDSTGQRIQASRVYVLTNNLVDSTEQGDFMLRMRSLTEDSSLRVIAYSPSFIFYEQYVAILPSTLQTVGIAVAVIFVVTALFMPSPLLILYVTVSMVMIMTGIFGFMYFWDLTLSSITMIHVIMSVGFSVDFSAHICHAFMTVEGKTRDEKVKNAILRSGGPIWNGAISSVIGIIMLVFSKSYIFRSFFRVMLLVILFGVGHATFFLPVVLSLIGPMENKKSENKSVSDIASMSSRGGHSNPALQIDERTESQKQISSHV